MPDDLTNPLSPALGGFPFRWSLSGNLLDMGDGDVYVIATLNATTLRMEQNGPSSYYYEVWERVR